MNTRAGSSVALPPANGDEHHHPRRSVPTTQHKVPLEL